MGWRSRLDHKLTLKRFLINPFCNHMGHLITTYCYKNQGDRMFDDSDTLIHIFFIPAKFSRHDKISRKIDPLFSPFTIILTEYLQSMCTSLFYLHILGVYLNYVQDSRQ